MMCGRILIQLTKSLNKVMEIGCIIREKNYSEVKYKFMSLLENNEKKIIQNMIKEDSDDLFDIIDFSFDR